MNLAFSAIVATVIILPAVIFWRAFTTTTHGSSLRASGLTEEFVVSIPVGVALHWALLSVVSLFGFSADYSTVVILLLAKSSDGPVVVRAIEKFVSATPSMLFYFAFLCLTAYGLGRCLQSLVMSKRLDKYLPFLTLNRWWYLLRLEDEDGDYDGVAIYVICELGNQQFEFRGVLHDFYTDSSGQLTTLVLAATTVRSLDAGGPTFPDAFSYVGFHAIEYKYVKSMKISDVKIE